MDNFPICVRCDRPITNPGWSEAEGGLSHRICCQNNVPVLSKHMRRYQAWHEREMAFARKLESIGKIHYTDASTKRTNPKDAVGTGKVPMSVIPAQVIAEIGLAMLEGARKYGRHNYRSAGVRGSVYYDATMRHLMAWWEGQDIDPDSKLSHITKALASLTVLRDGMLNSFWTDDRPPRVASFDGWVSDLNEKAAALVKAYPDAPTPFTEIEHGHDYGSPTD